MFPEIVGKEYGAQPNDLLRRAVVLDAFALVETIPHRAVGPGLLHWSLRIKGG
jgi:hypothetical protein